MAFLEKLHIKLLLIGKEKLVKILMIIAGVLFAITVVIAIVVENSFIPNKSHAKTMAQTQLSYNISNENVSLISVEFHNVYAKRFKTRNEDPVGYFAYIEGFSPIVDVDGKEYMNHLAYYRSRYGSDYNPETSAKWAYTLTGTYQAYHKQYGMVEGKFYMIYVNDGPSWCLVRNEIQYPSYP